MSVCEHLSDFIYNEIKYGTKVYKDECTQCFDTQDSENGINVCLSCFNGGCSNNMYNHSLYHSQHFKHPLVMNIKRTLKPKKVNEPPQKITKLEIVEEKQEDLYDVNTKIQCLICNKDLDRTYGKLPELIDSILLANSSKVQNEINSWEEEIVSCTHTENLKQCKPLKLEEQSLAHCSECDLKENLWLCMICGNLGCGRQQYGGIGGNGHALKHFETTGHAVSCKLGTITPEGNADIYCYTCNDSKLDNHLAEHLNNFGINIKSQKKTEKNITELQIEQNMNLDIKMTTKDGKELEPVYGPGFTGIENLGNSCYMSSILQMMFAIPEVAQRYLDLSFDQSLGDCKPAESYLCQMTKMADGLLSGRYSKPIDKNSPQKFQKGISPSMFKSLVGKGHPEFSTMKQQDAAEFYQYFLQYIELNEKKYGNDPTNVFKFSLHERLQCKQCKKVRLTKIKDNMVTINVPVNKKEGENNEYEPVSFDSCLSQLAIEEIVEFNCPNCKTKTEALKSTKFLTYPQYLVTKIERMKLVNWVPQKLAIPVTLPGDKIVDLDNYRSEGLKEGEEELENVEEEEEPTFNEAVVSQLMEMGFSRNRCIRAVMATDNNGAEVAMNWLFERMDDPSLDDPIEKKSKKNNGGVTADAQNIALLVDMGFNSTKVEKALIETNNNIERAIDWLSSHFEDDIELTSDQNTSDKIDEDANDNKPAKYELIGFVTHMGTSAQCGHYVVHLRRDNKWYLYNDEKVVKVMEDLPTENAYMYLFKRL
ncbi:ubiquitinyl hydrolase [Neocallimastix lanati (nom. inval.)]|jgi:ubiquitin carboxyl-terminal hydrolase 5/13|uniref:Ubiquitin carboxyl-terminal hydrolase n=1 Tax=Neocallimastix californiae TaxID=1754190 RepID=A0A1Y1ZVJ2_9FUNG|nr:ubiquitinyl hydrolase [Neocallimastix sp. JGI-2020a]ORY14238.1 ubiquitinyl hydrolase [Neocallimastix californiae]|eukprot:ORY14238.1 ubiquitinyl hydrolase [Neocallimastix californiae]